MATQLEQVCLEMEVINIKQQMMLMLNVKAKMLASGGLFPPQNQSK